ncbi:MAG: NAD-dependent epimerase/dehydratase family protein [Actinomycetota bacterium]
MKVLITGAAGNLGTFLAKRLMGGPHELSLLVHKTGLPFDVSHEPRVSVHVADLAVPETLAGPCRGVDCIVHFAGVLFRPHPERFLVQTNVGYVRNLVDAALAAGVGRFILVSFPHVEGISSPERPATGRLDGNPESVHARTRLAAEQHLFSKCEGGNMVPVVLRPGMIYGRGVLMIESGRWLARNYLLSVWQQPTWIHLLSLPDFLSSVAAAIEGEDVSGVYNLGDERPLTLQEFLDTLCEHWGYHRPWRLPEWMFYAAAWFCEVFAMVFKTRAPLTGDFIRIGMASYVSDVSRMKRELLPELAYPTLREGLTLL